MRMTRRAFLETSKAVLATSAFGLSLSAQVEKMEESKRSTRPNIVLILAEGRESRSKIGRLENRGP